MRGKGLRTLLLGPYALAAACIESLRVIRRRRPNVVLGFGGFASFPGALMGVASGKPLVLHDANAVAGLANRILAYGADRVLLGFPGALRGSMREACDVGRQSAARRHRRASIRRTRASPVARVRCACSSSAAASAPRRSTTRSRRRSRRLPRRDAPADRAPGRRAPHRRAARGVRERRASTAECVPFIDDMAARYAWADLVVCRGGALTVAELAAVGLGAIVVPLPGAIADEQSANARFLRRCGRRDRASRNPSCAAPMRRSPASLGALTATDALTMALAAHRVGKRDAADRVADVVHRARGSARR